MAQRTKFSWEQEVVDSDLPSTTRLLLLAISVRMNKFGEGCFPSIEHLAQMTGLSKRAVIKHRQIAIDAGWLKVAEMGFRGRKWRRSSYVAAFPGTTTCGVLLDDGEVTEGVEMGDEVVNEVHHLSQEGGERRAPEVVNEVHHVKEQTNYHTSLERERAGARDAENGGGEQTDRPPSSATTSGERFKTFWRKWPGRAVDSRTKAQAAWSALSDADQAAAVSGISAFSEAMKRAGRSKLPAAATYLGERKWADLDDELDSEKAYIPPLAKPYSPLWMAGLIELLRTGAARNHRFTVSQAADGKPFSLCFGRQRDDELAGIAKAFEKVQAGSATGLAWLRFLKRTSLALPRVSTVDLRLRDDFWLNVPSDQIAREWSIDLTSERHRHSIDAVEAFS